MLDIFGNVEYYEVFQLSNFFDRLIVDFDLSLDSSKWSVSICQRQSQINFIWGLDISSVFPFIHNLLLSPLHKFAIYLSHLLHIHYSISTSSYFQIASLLTRAFLAHWSFCHTYISPLLVTTHLWPLWFSYLISNFFVIACRGINELVESLCS